MALGFFNYLLSFCFAVCSYINADCNAPRKLLSGSHPRSWPQDLHRGVRHPYENAGGRCPSDCSPGKSGVLREALGKPAGSREDYLFKDEEAEPEEREMHNTQAAQDDGPLMGEMTIAISLAPKKEPFGARFWKKTQRYIFTISTRHRAAVWIS